jgi:hypothetical protein
MHSASVADRAALRARKAELKAAKRELREANRKRNVAIHLAAQARSDPNLADSAAVAAAEAAAAMSGVNKTSSSGELFCDDEMCNIASRRCGEAAATLMRRMGVLSKAEAGSSERATQHLLHAMTRGEQTLAMFDDTEALAGYVRRKFAQRARVIFTAICHARAILPPLHAARLSKARHVVSVGGGPANCLFGWVLAEEMELRRPAEDRSSLTVWDFAAHAWSPWWAMIDATLLGESGRLSGETCDVTRPLTSEHKEAAASVDIFLISRLLTETRGRWHAWMRALFAAAKPGAIFVCSEGTNWQLTLLLEMLRQTGQLAISEWLDVRRGPAPPSVLLLVKIATEPDSRDEGNGP